MSRAIILTVDDDAAVSKAITRDLRARYGERYRLVRSTPAPTRSTTLEEFQRRDQPVALIVSDHRMPEMTGIEFLERSIDLSPGAKRVLLTAYADTDVAIKAINDIGLDHYLMKPWAPPEERLFPVLDDLLSDWERANDTRFDGIRVVGNRWSERSYDTRMFLARNHVHYQWLELERDAEAQRLHELFGSADRRSATGAAARRHGAARARLGRAGRCARAADPRRVHPLRPHRDRRRSRRSRRRRVRGLRGPAHRGHRARRARRTSRAERSHRELPGVPERPQRRRPLAPGHDAGPAARRRDGASPAASRRSEQRGSIHAVCFADGTEIEARAVVIATGVAYRLMAADGLGELTGRGVYYGASASDARGTEGEDVYVVGAANSAGQAALAPRALRAAGRDAGAGRVARHLDVEVPRGADRVRHQHRRAASRPRWCGVAATVTSSGSSWSTATRDGRSRSRPASCTCSSARRPTPTGSATASPGTSAGSSSPARTSLHSTVIEVDGRSSERRSLLETSRPGVFAAGDVRLASMKRVASAVGEGSSAVSNVHLYLETV